MRREPGSIPMIGSGMLAFQLGVMALVLELGLTRASGGPQLGVQVIFDTVIGSGLAVGHTTGSFP